MKDFLNAIQWPVTPECLQWGPKFLYERYHKPIYITENGLSCHDVISLDGKVHDPNRIDFLARYLRELRKAAEEADIRGYFQWSLMDNFEWAKGYSDRFGLVYVDYRNQERIMKDSAFWYKHVIETNGAELLNGNKRSLLGLFSSVNNKCLTIYKEWCRVKVSKEFHRIGCNSVHYPIQKRRGIHDERIKANQRG